MPDVHDGMVTGGSFTGGHRAFLACRFC